MRSKGIQASFRVPIREYDENGICYDLEVYRKAVMDMVGAPVTNGDGTVCYGVITNVTAYEGNDYYDVEATLFSGGTVERMEMIDCVANTKSIMSFALAENWRSKDDPVCDEENTNGYNMQ